MSLASPEPRRHAKSSMARVIALVCVGGSLFQLVGCAAGLAPVYLSLAESALLSLLLSQFAP